MTLSKLAQLANVSVSVVSKAFSGRDGVSESMREHVFAVAKEYGCFEQFYHAPYDKPVIAVIIPEAISEHYIKYVQLLKCGMEKNGYTMLLSISNFDEAMTRELIRYYNDHGNVDAIVTIGGMPNVRCKEGIVLIGMGDNGNPSASTIKIDLSHGLESALLHLKEQGHRRIGCVVEPLVESKAKLMKSIMEKHGMEISPELFVCARGRFAEAGKEGVRKLLALGDEKMPTAIFGGYGQITQGIIEELEACGLSVPKDMSVISMNEDSSLTHHSVEVSYISSMTERVCEEILRILGERIGSKTRGNIEMITVPTQFIVGETTKNYK